MRTTIEYLRNYWEATYTHDYIMGVEGAKFVRAYVLRLDFEGLCLLFSDKPTESKGGMVIKYRQNKRKVAYMEANAVQVFDLCTLQELQDKRRIRTNRHGKPYRENCGECFEWLVAEYLHGTQNAKANLKHTEGGDISVDGKQYQVKFERAGIAIG